MVWNFLGKSARAFAEKRTRNIGRFLEIENYLVEHENLKGTQNKAEIYFHEHAAYLRRFRRYSFVPNYKDRLIIHVKLKTDLIFKPR